MNYRHLSLALFGLALCLAGCGQRGQVTATVEKVSEPSKSAGSGPAAGPAEGPDAGASGSTETEPGTPIDGPTGRIEGTVKFVGDEIPQPTIVNNGTDPQICGAAMSKRDYEISPSTHGIRYVLVWLEGVKLHEGYKPPTQTLILDNTKCQFEPHAAVITAGSTIETRNSDEVYHTTNLKGKVTTENIPLTHKGTSYKTKVRTADLIGVSCDKHGWMQAFIRVDPHPFHTVTDADGKFSIAGVPVGTYKLKVFHGEFKGQQHEVTVAENETATLDVKYPTESQK